MPVDPGNIYIDYYNSTDANNDPDGTETRKEGDDHIRGVKGTLARSFPAVAGAVTPDQDELNTLDGISTATSLETRLQDIESKSALFTTGTTVVFFQQTLPVGYSEVGAPDTMMRCTTVASGEGGGPIQGLHSPVYNDKVYPHNHTFTTDSAGTHTHQIVESTSGGGSTTAFSDAAVLTAQVGANRSGYIVNGGAHTHPGASDNNTGADAIAWEPKYINVILGRKD